MKKKYPKLAKIIGKNLLNMCAEQGYQSLHDMAEQNDLREATLYEIRRGDRVPTIPTLLELAEVLDASLDDFTKGYKGE